MSQQNIREFARVILDALPILVFVGLLIGTLIWFAIRQGFYSFLVCLISGQPLSASMRVTSYALTLGTVLAAFGFSFLITLIINIIYLIFACRSATKETA